MSTQICRLSRRVTFSSGHRYWIPALSEAENRGLFGPWASPYNHGHNYALWCTVEGEVDPDSGMVVNIKDIDDVLDQVVVARFDQKSINDEIEHFQTRSTSTENILLYIHSLLTSGALPPGCRLTSLKLIETEDLSAEYSEDHGTWTMTLTRSYEFAASHRLHVPSYTDEKNVELFGKCNNAAGHGHNYVLEVTVSGAPNPETGMIADIGEIDRIVEQEVVDRYDHKHLNVDLPEFQDRAPTSEVIAAEIFSRLSGKIANLDKVRLYETARSYFEVGR